MNDTLNCSDVAHEPKTSVRTRIAAATAVVGTALVAPAGAAFAQTPPPEGEAEAAAGAAITGIGSDVVSFTTTYGIPAVAIVLGVGVFVSLLMKWGRKLPRMAG